MPQSTSTTCPRCGYDLRGTMTTWTRACPLEGTCTECGLAFEWADVFDRTRKEPAWCVEHARRGIWPVTRAIVATFLRSWLPWRFWHRLQLHHHIRISRLALYFTVTFMLPMAFLYVTIQTGAAVIVCSSLRAEAAQAKRETAAIIADHQAMLTRWQQYEQPDDVPEHALDDGLDYASHDRVTRVDRQRVELWQEPPQNRDEWNNLRRAIIDIAERRIEWHTPQLERIEIDISTPRTILAAIFTPLSERSIGHRRTYGATLVHLTPLELHEILVIPQVDWLWFPLWQRLHETSWRALLWLAAVFIMPLTFLLVPLTIRRSRMQPLHVMRIAVYGAWIPILVFWIVVPTVAWMVTGRPRSLMGQGDGPVALMTFGPLPLMLAWWYCAIRWHLRFRMPLLTTLLLAVVTATVIVTAAYFLFGVEFWEGG